jgi:organic radical activating enzyme
MKLKVSEIFYSAQGEGRFIGVPSVFLRTFGCNFTCGGFGMKDRTQMSTEREFIDPTKYRIYEELPWLIQAVTVMRHGILNLRTLVPC